MNTTSITKTSFAKTSLAKKSVAFLFAALAIGGAAIATAENAEARPRHGWHGHHRPHHWGHRHHWRGYGVLPVAYVGTRCRLVERVNRYGDVVLRRVCARPMYY